MIIILMRSGFSLKEIFGQDYMVDGLTYEQMTYYYNACVSVDAKENDDRMVAFARVMASNEDRKRFNKDIDKKRSHAFTELEKI